LVNLGAKLPFDGAQADFTGITGDSAERLFISQVIHQAVVEVNERGTEAAAATTVLMLKSGGMMRQNKPIELICDRPFLFFIHETIKNKVLFLGKYSEPI
jgi:serpin B